MLGVHFNHQRKLKKEIEDGWGKLPRSSRHDQEKSLRRSYENLKTRLQHDSDVDDITWNDLDLYAIFQDINHTHSSIGSEALYRRLRQFDFNADSFQRVENYIQFYTEQPKTRQKIEFIFLESWEKGQ